MQLPISELEETHPGYNPVVMGSLRALETYSDFHSGGRRFEANKDRYLISRPIEAATGGGQYRASRLACYYYTPHSGGIGDNLCGTALQYPPTIAITGEAVEGSDYWIGLNTNFDGKGSDTRSVAWALLNSLIVHRRAYLVVNFSGGKDATFTALSAKDVDDWQIDENGQYEWIRAHCVDLVRSGGTYSPQDTERHTWTFYDAQQTVEYVAERKIGTPWPKDAVAESGTPMPHGLGECPVYPVEVEENFWVMDRLFSTAHAYFNREGSRSFAITTSALSLPVVKTKKDVNNLVMANGFCIKLDVGDDFGYASPDSGIYDALKDDCDYLLGNLYSALNQMALNAAGQAGNPRQSGTAKSADGAAIKAFLSLLCTPVMAAIRKAIKAVQVYREEDALPIDVHGMTNFDVQSIELEINRCLTFLTIPGVPPTARKESLRRAIRAYLPDISDDAREDINEELERIPEPVSEAPDSSGILNATTGKPQGFAPGQVSQQFTKMAIHVPSKHAGIFDDEAA